MFPDDDREAITSAEKALVQSVATPGLNGQTALFKNLTPELIYSRELLYEIATMVSAKLLN